MDRANRATKTAPTKRPQREVRQRPPEQKPNTPPLARKVGSPDYTAFLMIILLVAIGVLMVTSSSFYIASIYKRYNNDALYLFKRQGMFAIAGTVIMIAASRFNYQHYMKISPIAYIVGNVMLIGIFFTGLSANGASRWLAIPIIGQFQPSEVAKICLILFLSFIIHKNKNLLTKPKGFIICLGAVGVTTVLVIINNMTTGLIVGVIGVGIMFVASPYWKIYVAGAMSATGAIVAFLTLSSGFRNERLAAWINPFDFPQGVGFQIIQSLYAIASGGMFGLGIANSRQKSFIPEPHNDFIFAVICEELGAFGAGIVLLLFGILIWRGIKIAMEATDVFGTLIATGIVIMIATQTLINVAVVTNSIPNTGVTLPLVSYGGTSLIITMFMMGVLLNISRHYKE